MVSRYSGVDIDEVDGVLGGIFATCDTSSNAVNGDEVCRFPGDFSVKGGAKRF
jgi:hypothetical protein